MSLQERYLDEPIPLIVHTDHGTDKLMLRGKDMTQEQAAQVFGPNRVRTDAEQKAYILEREHRLRTNVNSARDSWTIKKGKLHIGSSVLDKHEVMLILAKMEGLVS